MLRLETKNFCQVCISRLGVTGDEYCGLNAWGLGRVELAIMNRTGGTGSLSAFR